MGFSVTKRCNKVVDRLWAGNLFDVPRTIWKGALSFGLVNIPVGLYPATSDKSIHFNQFEEGTSDRIRYKKVNERTGTRSRRTGSSAGSTSAAASTSS